MYGLCAMICILATINNSVIAITSCEVMHEFYKILGCKLINNSQSDLCQSSFECLQEFDSDKCYFHGKTYSIGEIVPDNYTESVCTFDCECMKAPNSPASFECSESCECDPYNNTCIQQFNSSQACCSDKTICDRAEIEKLKKCYLEGRSYHLGAQMHPITDSYTCLCTEDFDNATSYSENSNCAKIDCEAVTISFARSLWDECAPVFVEPICCADTFKCPNKNDKIDSKSRSIEESDGSICKFGNLTLRRGEELEPEHTKYYDNLCKCEMPPILTCLRRYYN